MNAQAELLTLTERVEIDRRCDLFDEVWSAGNQPHVADFVADAPVATRPFLVVELLLIEFEYQTNRRDQTPQVEEYLAKLPHDASAVRAAFAQFDRGQVEARGNASDTWRQLTADESTGAVNARGEVDTASSLAGKSKKSTVGSFKIVREHASGGLGQIWVADDEDLHRSVAIKEIKQSLVGDERIRSRFLREVNITSRLGHPNIVPVYGLGRQADGSPFYVMPLIRGEDLGEFIQRLHHNSPGDPAQQLRELRKLLGRFVDVCNAIEYAHSQGVIHRDIKPRNVMLGNYGETLVIDWGLAKTVSAHGDVKLSEPVLESFDSTQCEATRWGDRLGTLRYMSPEQAAGRNEEVGPASDIYNLGATLYHLLTGCPPYSSEENTLALIDRIQRGDFEPVRQKNRRIPRALDAICQQAMATKVEHRYASADHLAMDIERWLADEPVSARQESVSEKTSRWVRRHRSWTLAGGTALLLITFVSLTAVLLINRAREHQAQSARDNADLANDKSNLAEEKSRLAEELGIALNDSQRTSETLKDQLRTNQVQHWINSSRGIRDETPQRSLLLATEALHVAQLEKLAVLPQAHGNLRDALDLIGGLGLSTDVRLGSDLAMSPNSRWLVASDHLDVRLWDLTADDPTQANVLLPSGFAISNFTFSPDSRWLVASRVKTARLWDLTAEDIALSSKSLNAGPWSEWLFDRTSSRVMAIGEAGVTTWNLSADDLASKELQDRVVAVSPDTRWIMTSNNGEKQLLDSAPMLDNHRVVLLPHSENFYPVTLGPNRRWLAATNASSLTQLTVDVAPLPLPGNQAARAASGVVKTKDCWIVAHEPVRQESVRLWDLSGRSPSITSEFFAHKGGVNSIAITPNGRWLVTVGGDRTIRLWDLTTEDVASETFELAVLNNPVDQFAISSDSRWLIASVVGESIVRLWDLSARNPAATSIVLRGHDGEVSRLAISPDCRWLTTSRWGSKTIRLWDLMAELTPSSAEVLHRTTGLATFALSADSRRVAAIVDFEGISNSGQSVHLLQPEQTLTTELTQCLQAAFRGAISPDHHWAATKEGDGVRLWNLVNDSASFRIEIPGSPSHLSFSPDSRRLFASTNEDRVYFCDMTTENASDQVVALGQHPEVRQLDASSDGRWLVTTSFGFGTTKLWDLKTDPASSVVVSEKPSVTTISPCISPDSRWLAFVDPDLRLIDLTAPNPMPSTRRIQGQHLRPVISPDSRWLAAVRNGRVVCYELPLDSTGKTRTLLVAPEVEPTWMTFSQDSRWLVAGSYDRAAHMWDLQADDPAATETVFAGHNDTVNAATVSRSGRWLLTGSDDRTVRLWDLTAPSPADSSVVFRGHKGRVTSVSMSEDEQWLVSVGGDVRLWDLRIDVLVDRARRVAGRELTARERNQYRMDVLKPSVP